MERTHDILAATRLSVRYLGKEPKDVTDIYELQRLVQILDIRGFSKLQIAEATLLDTITVYNMLNNPRPKTLSEDQIKRIKNYLKI